MFKVKALNIDNIVKFDNKQSPIYISRIDDSFYINLGLRIDPLASLQMDVNTLKVQISTLEYQGPPIFDNVVNNKDIKGNILNIGFESTKSYNNFLENHVLYQNEFAFAPILQIIAPNIAYAYGEGSSLADLNAMRQDINVALTNRNNKKELRDTTPLQPNVIYTIPELTTLIDDPSIRDTLNINSTYIKDYTQIAPKTGKVTSNIIHYPYPVSENLEQYRDIHSSKMANYTQLSNRSLLASEDFEYDDKSFKTLASAYQEFTAYNESSINEIYIKSKKMKWVPYALSIPYDGINQENIIISLFIKNSNGVLLATLIRDLNLQTHFDDMSKPIDAPLISATKNIEENVMNIEVTQRDVNSTSITLMIKETPISRFVVIGTPNISYNETYETPYNLTATQGTAIIRAIAKNKTNSSSAFLDLPIQLGVEDNATQNSTGENHDNPNVSTKLNLHTIIKKRAEGEGFDITIETSTDNDGTNTLLTARSIYDELLVRRLKPKSGDVPHGIPGEDGGEFVKNEDGTSSSITPNDKWVDKGVTEGMYTYVVDGYINGEEIIDIVHTTFPVGSSRNLDQNEADEDLEHYILYDVINFKITPRSAVFVIQYNELDWEYQFELTFKASTSTKDINIPDHISNATIDILTSNLETYSINVGDYLYLLKKPKIDAPTEYKLTLFIPKSDGIIKDISTGDANEGISIGGIKSMILKDQFVSTTE